MGRITIDEIIDLCGGDTAVAFQLKRHAYTVRAWRENGIPSKYWRKIIELCPRKIAVTDLLDANDRVQENA